MAENLAQNRIFCLNRPRTVKNENNNLTMTGGGGELTHILSKFYNIFDFR